VAIFPDGFAAGLIFAAIALLLLAFNCFKYLLYTYQIFNQEKFS